MLFETLNYWKKITGAGMYIGIDPTGMLMVKSSFPIPFFFFNAKVSYKLALQRFNVMIYECFFVNWD